MYDSLTPDVRRLVDDGVLHPWDAEWIARLSPETQLAAARKMIYGTPLELAPMDNPKSCVLTVPKGSRR